MPPCLPCPAAPLALPAPDAGDEEQQAARRQALQSLSLAAPPLAPPKLDGRSGKKAKEAAAAAQAAEAAAAADLAPLREGDSLALTRIKLDMLRCQRGLPAGALTKGQLAPPAWQQAVRDADSVPALRKLLGEVSSWQAGVSGCIATALPACPPGCLGVPLTALPSSPTLPPLLMLQLEAAVEPEHIHPLYLRQPPLVRGAWLPTGGQVADALTLAELPESPTAAGLEGSPVPGFAAAGSAEKAGGSAAAAGAEGGAEAEGEEEVAAREPLAWLPATLASLALRLQALDAALLYTSGQPAAREQLEVRKATAPHCRCGRLHAARLLPCHVMPLLCQHIDRHSPVLPAPPAGLSVHPASHRCGRGVRPAAG